MYLIRQLPFRFFGTQRGLKLSKYSSVSKILILQRVKKRYNVMGFVVPVACDTDIPCLLFRHMTLLDLGKKKHFYKQYAIKQIVRAACHYRIQDIFENK